MPLTSAMTVREHGYSGLYAFSTSDGRVLEVCRSLDHTCITIPEERVRQMVDLLRTPDYCPNGWTRLGRSDQWVGLDGMSGTSIATTRIGWMIDRTLLDVLLQFTDSHADFTDARAEVVL